MMLRFFDGFESYGPVGTDGTLLEGRLASRYEACSTLPVWNAFLTGGRLGGVCLNWSAGSSDKILEKQWDSDGASTWVVGFAFRPPHQTNAVTLLRISDSTGYSFLNLTLTGKNQLEVSQSGGFWYLPTYYFAPFSWVYLEVKLTIDETSGAIEVRADGASILQQTGINTKNAGMTLAHRVALCNDTIDRPTGIDDILIDDFYICDGEGSTYNDFLGSVLIEKITPASDANTTWESTEASRHGAVRNSSEDTYIWTSEEVEQLFGFTDVAPSTEVLAVLVMASTKLAIDGTADLSLVCHVEVGNVGYSEVSSITTTEVSSVYWMLTSEPDGGAWTPSDVNATQFGVKRGT